MNLYVLTNINGNVAKLMLMPSTDWVDQNTHVSCK